MTKEQFEELADKILVSLVVGGNSEYRNIQGLEESGFDIVYVASSLMEEGLIEDFTDPLTEKNWFMFRIKPEGMRLMESGGYKKRNDDKREKERLDKVQRDAEFTLVKENLKWVKWLAWGTIATGAGTIGLVILEIIKMLIEHHRC